MQIFTLISTPNNALCILPKIVEAKQVENILFEKATKSISKRNAYVITKYNWQKIYNIEFRIKDTRMQI